MQTMRDRAAKKQRDEANAANPVISTLRHLLAAAEQGALVALGGVAVVAVIEDGKRGMETVPLLQDSPTHRTHLIGHLEIVRGALVNAEIDTRTQGAVAAAREAAAKAN